MQLRPRLALTTLLIAVPAALILLYAITAIRAEDMSLALERVVKSQINAQVRERCESDPRWFLTGPLTGRPKRGELPNPDPEALAPRAKVEEQPFELFAFDEEFMGSSTASPRFPNDLRIALRTSPTPVIAPFATKDGTGVQMAAWTGWIGGPCAVFLGRMRPDPHAFRQKLEQFTGLFAVCYIVAMLAVMPSVRRVRRLANDMRQAAAEQHASIAPDQRKDEISSVAFTYNEVAKTLHERTSGNKDRDETLRRFIEDAASVSVPIGAIGARLGTLEMRQEMPTGVRDELRLAVRETHDLGSRLRNSAVAADLHVRRTAVSWEACDLESVVTDVVRRHNAFAHALGVSLAANLTGRPVTVTADRVSLDQAVANIVDNAIRYNRPGGNVTVELSRPDEGHFVLRIRDDGIGVSDEAFKALTGIRRFRGDEGRNRQPGAPGLGLAVAREVVERLGWKLDLGRPVGGGFEVEVNGTLTLPAPR